MKHVQKTTHTPFPVFIYSAVPVCPMRAHGFRPNCCSSPTLMWAWERGGGLQSHFFTPRHRGVLQSPSSSSVNQEINKQSVSSISRGWGWDYITGRKMMSDRRGERGGERLSRTSPMPRRPGTSRRPEPQRFNEEDTRDKRMRRA